MPAKKRNEPKYKSFLGRVFTLRNHKYIPASRTQKSKKFNMKPEQLGQAVLVLDEDNARVRVCATEGGAAWIPKFYLHEEVTSAQFKEIDNLSTIMQAILDVSTELQEKYKLCCEDKKEVYPGILKFYSSELLRIANLLRHHMDTIDPTNKNKS